MAETHTPNSGITRTSRRRRVGYFIDTQAWGGAEAVVLSCCQAMQGSEYEPVLLHFDNHELARKCGSNGVEVISVPDHALYKRGTRLPGFAASFARLLRSHDISLLHSHLYGPIVAGALAAKLAGRPHVGTLHDIYVIEESAWRLPLLCLARLLRTQLVAVSNHMRAHYARKPCLRSANIATIYNGIGTHAPKASTRSEFIKRWGGKEDDIIFICVARFVTLKRHELLIKAFSELDDLSDVRLVFYGEGPQQQAVSDLVQSSNMSSRIVLAGHSEEIEAALNAADVFVLASDTEGLSRSILEAMASGLPIIATNVGGNPELVTDNGILAPAGDASGLATAMRSLAIDPERRHRLARNSRANASTQFSGESMLNGYLKIYGQMLHA